MNTAITYVHPPATSEVETCIPRSNEAMGTNKKRLSLIFSTAHDEVDVFELFGWEKLPSRLKEAVRTDLEAYRDEVLGLYSSRDAGVKKRRQRVVYWIKAFMDALCTEETAVDALRVTR
ncbi:hypothetical protein QLX67_00935 [Balneolaceae bacterium ANBcel3]|nr:hypothetical protein [Balneolaceae bacterium ANBcel3]